MPGPADALVRAELVRSVLLLVLAGRGAGAAGPWLGEWGCVLARDAAAEVEIRNRLEEGGAAAGPRDRVWVLEEADTLVHRHITRRRVVQVAQQVLGKRVVEPRDLIEELVNRGPLAQVAGHGRHLFWIWGVYSNSSFSNVRLGLRSTVARENKYSLLW